MTAKKRTADIEEYAREQARTRLGKLAEEVARASGEPTPDAIHDLRVSIRRFGQCLRIFGQFFPAGKRRRVRRRLRRVMDLAAEIRDRDIALELLAKAGVPERYTVARMLASERTRVETDLVAAVQRWHSRGFSEKWSTQLEL